MLARFDRPRVCASAAPWSSTRWSAIDQRRIDEPCPFHLGPALVAGDFNGLWIYLLAPVVGGVIAALAYLFLRGDESPAPR